MKTAKTSRKFTTTDLNSKKPPTSYNLFFRDEHERMIQARDPEVKSPMLSRIIGGRWRVLDTASRCRYQLMAAKLLSEHKEGNSKRLGNKKNKPPINSQEEIDAESLYEALKTSNAGNQQIISSQPQEIKSMNKICIERQEATFVIYKPLIQPSADDLVPKRIYFSIKSTQAFQWNKNFQLLAEFKNQNGHLQVPRKSEYSLSKWVQIQRASHRKGLLSADRIQLLDAIGFVWEPLQHRWDTQYHHLVELKKQTSHLGWPRLIDKELHIKWVNSQRRYYERGSLSVHRQRMLHAIGFNYSAACYHRDTLFHQTPCRQKEKPIRKKNELFQQQQQKGKAFDYNRRQQQETQAPAVATLTLKQPFTPSRAPDNVTNQTFIKMEDDNVDPNICEEFEEIVTYGDSEYWV